MDYSTLFDFNTREHKISGLEELKSIKFDTLDSATKNLISNLANDIKECDDKISELQTKLSDYGKTNNGIPLPEDMDIFDEQFEHHYKQHCDIEHLTALAEMKIIYIFKSLEIHMKQLINKAYPNIKTKGFYQWENMINYFKSIDIVVSDIQGYQEANDLRKVNNNIKHSSVINEEVSKINEFSSIEYFDYDSLSIFYNRVINKTEKFFYDLVDCVIKDLFEYSSERIEKLAKDYAARMESKKLQEFISKLQEQIK